MSILVRLSSKRELSQDVKANLDVLRDALTETQEALQQAHNNLQEDNDIEGII